MNSLLFNAEVACVVGVNGAIMMQNIAFWVEKNRANEKNFHDGKYWTYNSVTAFAKIFRFWTERQIRRILDNLERDGYIATGNYNKNVFDMTKWYTLTEKGEELMNVEIIKTEPATPTGKTVRHIEPNSQAHLTKRSSTTDRTVRPIPDNKPDNKPDSKPTDILSGRPDDVPEVEVVEPEIVEQPKSQNIGQQNPVAEIIDHLNNVVGTHFKPTTPKTVKLIHCRLKEGFTVGDFFTVIDKMADEWLGDDRMVMYLRPDTLFSTKFESYLNRREADPTKAKVVMSDRDRQNRAFEARLMQEAKENDRRNGAKGLEIDPKLLSW